MQRMFRCFGRTFIPTAPPPLSPGAALSVDEALSKQTSVRSGAAENGTDEPTARAASTTGSVRAQVSRADPWGASSWFTGEVGGCVISGRLRSVGEELSKRKGVLFHWWPLSSKWNDRLQQFFTDISLI